MRRYGCLLSSDTRSIPPMPTFEDTAAALAWTYARQRLLPSLSDVRRHVADRLMYLVGRRARLLDVGGGATKERVSEAFKIILYDDNVKAVLINIFGGIVRCDLTAEGVVGAVEEIGVEVPVVARLEGNNSELGRKVLADSGLNIIAATSLTDAAQQAVKAAGGAA